MCLLDMPAFACLAGGLGAGVMDCQNHRSGFDHPFVDERRGHQMVHRPFRLALGQSFAGGYAVVRLGLRGVDPRRHEPCVPGCAPGRTAVLPPPPCPLCGSCGVGGSAVADGVAHPFAPCLVAQRNRHPCRQFVQQGIDTSAGICLHLFVDGLRFVGRHPPVVARCDARHVSRSVGMGSCHCALSLCHPRLSRPLLCLCMVAETVVRI